MLFITTSKIITGSRLGTKAICAVVDDNGNALPLLAVDNGDGTATLKVDSELTATIDPTGLATSAKQDTGIVSLNSIDEKLTTLLANQAEHTALLESILEQLDLMA